MDKFLLWRNAGFFQGMPAHGTGTLNGSTQFLPLVHQKNAQPFKGGDAGCRSAGRAGTNDHDVVIGRMIRHIIRYSLETAT